MQGMAERLGFDLISLRLELFGRRRDQPTAAAGKTSRRSAPRRSGGSSGGDTPDATIPDVGSDWQAGHGGSESGSHAPPATVQGRAAR